MINKFQKRGLGILRDIPQIDPLRIPDQVELTDFTGVDFDFVQNCDCLIPFYLCLPDKKMCVSRSFNQCYMLITLGPKSDHFVMPLTA